MSLPDSQMSLADDNGVIRKSDTKKDFSDIFCIIPIQNTKSTCAGTL